MRARRKLGILGGSTLGSLGADETPAPVTAPVLSPKFMRFATYAEVAAHVAVVLGGAYALWRAFHKRS